MATILSSATGNFNDGTKWVGGIAPATSDYAQIQSGHNMTLTGSQNLGAIQIQSGGTLTGGVQVDMTGTAGNVRNLTINNSALSVTNTGGTAILDGTFTITAGAFSL